MGYCTKQEAIYALANALTSGNPAATGTLVDILTIGKSLTNTVPPPELLQYIRWADAEIDSKISSIYNVPLKRINQGSFPLSLDATMGDQRAILADATRFTEGDVVLIRDDVNTQQLTVDAYTDDSTVNFIEPLLHDYSSADTNIEKIRYPEPIPLVSARLAAAFIYDKHFAAQQEGNESNFGKALRGTAYSDLNQVLSGAVRLAAADANTYVGRRYVNGALFDVLPTRAEAGKTWFEGPK